MDNLLNSNSILKQFRNLIGVVVVLSGLAVGILYLVMWSANRTDRIWFHFHQTAINHASKIKEEVLQLKTESARFTYKSSGSKNSEGSAIDLNLYLGSIQNEMENIRALHEEFPHPEFESTVTRLDQQWENLRVFRREKPTEKAVSLQQVERQASLFFSAVDQYQRLHWSIKYDLDRQEHLNSQRGKIALVIGFLLIMIFARFSVGRITRQVTDIITREQEAGEALQESQSMFQSLSEISPVGIWRSDATGRTLYLNKLCGDLIGLPPGEILGLDWAQNLHPDDRGRVLAKWSRCIEDKNPFKTEFRFLHPDGKTLCVFGQATPQLSPQGQIVGFVGTITDITERKQAEESFRVRVEKMLNDSNFQLELILNSAGEGIYGLDMEGKTTFINPAAELMLGYFSGELTGKTQHDLIHHSHADGTPYLRSDCQIYKALQSGQPQSADTEVFWRKDGSSFPVEYISTPILENGEVVGAVVTFRDITERKQVESKLIATKEVAEKASTAKSDFLARMSHELRTPMNSILGFSQLLAQDHADNNLSKEQKEGVSYIIKAGNHLLEMINDVLDLSSLEKGNVNLSIEPVDVFRLTEQLITLMRPMADTQEVELVNALDRKTDSTVLGDQQRLRQVLLNLMTNAVKYNRPGGKVTVSCERKFTGEMVIRVSDNGPGIPEEKQSSLFKPFERLGAENTGVGGTGIGLVIAKELVETMGGKIGFESQEGEGTCFYIELPNKLEIKNGQYTARDD